MPSVDASSLREEFDAVNEHIASLRQAGKISGESDAAIGVLCSLLSILIVVFLEKTMVHDSWPNALHFGA